MRLRKDKGDQGVGITAQEAKELSEAALARAHERWPAVRQVAESLRGSREDNHFSERIARTFREVRP